MNPAITSRRQLLTAGLFAGAACRRKTGKLIGVVPKATSHLFFVSIHRGVDAAAKEFGVEVEWNGPREETEHTRQIQIVDAMVAQGVDALAISATDERALAGPVERAIRAGIPVAIFDSGVDVEGYVSFVATDNYGAGAEAARLLAGMTGGRKVAMLMHKPGGTSTNLREQGFQETLARDYPGKVLAAKQYGMSDAARARGAAENILTAHPDLAGIFSSSEASSLGAIQAIRSRDLSGKVKLITFDNSAAHVEALRESTTEVMMVQDAFRLGYEPVKALVMKLRGETPVRHQDIPARVIRREDLDKPEIQALLTSQRPEN